MRIQHNIMAMNAYRNFVGNNSALGKNLEKLSSGYRINRAGDDAAGLAISEKMRAQITGLDAAQKNVKDGISLVKTAEGAMQEIQDMMNRMKYLATQSANGTYQNDVDRENLQKEVDALKTEINRIADSSNFNGQKLLNGELAAQDLSVDDIKESTQILSKGITVDTGSSGKGSKGEFTLDVTSTFGADDTLAVALSDSSTVTLTYNTDFKGTTVEEQAASIAEALGKNATITSNYDVSVEGSMVKLTNKVEGNDQVNVTGITATDKTITAAVTNTAAGAATPLTKGGFDKLFGGASDGTGVMDVKAGDELVFKFNDGIRDWTAKVTVTDDMIGNTTDLTTEKIAVALENAKFEDIEGTVADESLHTVGSMIDVVPNKKSNGTDALAGGMAFKDAAAVNSGMTVVSVTKGATTVAANTAGDGVKGTGQKVTIDFTNTTGTNASTLAYGDKLTIAGKLSDGRDFSLDVVAGKDFEIDSGSQQNTMTNLINKLKITGMDMELSDGAMVSSKDVFGAGKEFDIALNANNVDLEITAAKGGTVASSSIDITNTKFTAADAADVTSSLINGNQQTAATSSLTFDNKLEYGATVEIGGETYQVVKDEADLTNKNYNAVVVADPADSNAVAKAFADKLNAAGGDFTAKAVDNKVTLTTTAKGSDVQATSINASGDKVTTASFKLDPSKIKAGSYLSINGNTYEFVNKGDKPTNRKATAVEIDDFAAATSKSLGDALAAVADGKNASVKVAEDGTVNVQALADDEGVIADPEVKFYGGLTLQIGDTADSFNQLSVGVNDMHTDALGIANLDVSTLEDAQVAIEKITDAINKVSSTRGDLGAIQNRLEHTANNLSVMEENITDAESTIRDTDMADEMTTYTKNNILMQAAQAMLAQANQQPQGVLQLLQ